MEELTKTNKTNKIDYTITPISFYKFVCEEESIVSTYVGHTANFTRRKNQHKTCCNNEKGKNYNLKIYQTIRANGGWDNWRMIEIKSQLCENKRHAERIEQELIDQLKAELNTRKSFYDGTKDEYDKEYYNENKDTIDKYQKEYRLNNKEKMMEYKQTNKEKINKYKKEYCVKNKEKILEQQRKNYQKNKEERLEKRRQNLLKKKLEKLKQIEEIKELV
jgi:hypothetical protein